MASSSEEHENVHELFQEKTAPKKGSIFDRLPGLGRFRSEAKEEDPINNEELDIPSFLRKGG